MVDMANITIQSATERNNGWSYQVKLENDREYNYDVTLSQSDYNQWSQGKVSPEQLVEAAFEFLLEREPASSIMSKFDCAVIRRYFPEVDSELPKKL
ncbi:hypothetical protein [Coleofasciculus sp. F4-SAH-05]|uniref:hypothetical protein n=1 Tax=Coleofasciculus sp. F4-SAH-05 TaxID=3069525 RepID=UPI0032F8F88B